MSATPIHKVALAGATGALGTPMLQALLDAGFAVTALTRASSNSTTSFPASVQVAPVDYDDVSSLTAALQGQDAVVSTIGSAAIEHQLKLVDAAAAAGIRRFIPSEFGSDTLNPKTSQLPVFKDKVAVQERVIAKCQETGGKMTYTLVQNSAFLDWCIEHKVLIDVVGKQMTLCDGGDNPFSTTTLASVAKATAASLVHADETKNRAVKIHDVVITQKQLLAIAQKVVGTEGWTVKNVDTAEGVEKANEDMRNGKVEFPQVLAWLQRAIFAEGYGGNFKDVDNALVGLKGISEDDIEEIIRKRA